MSEMVDRVARALGECVVPDNRFSLRDLLVYAMAASNGPATAADLQRRERAIDRWLGEFARAAIAAMREPSEAMQEAGREAKP